MAGAAAPRPGVGFFGESVPRARGQHGFDALDASRSVLVLGSSLAVMSGYRFVRRAAARGIPVAIVTHGVTRGDAQATLRLDEPLAPTLGRLVAALS